MKNAPDSTMILEKWQGCAGKAWGYQAPVLGDLTVTKNSDETEWGLLDEQRELTKNLLTVLSYPIRHPKDPDTIVGILSFDSPKAISKHFASPGVQESVSLIAAEIASILSAIGIILSAHATLSGKFLSKMRFYGPRPKIRLF